MYNNTIPNKIYNPYGNNGYLNPFIQPQGIYPQPQQLPQTMQQPMQTQQQSGFNIIPVANADEAKAVQTPFDGSILILPNINNGKIYTKQLNMNTGSAIFNEYSISTPVAVTQQQPTNTNNVVTPAPVYATQKELDDLRQELLDKLNALNNIQQVAEVASDKPLFANTNKANKKDTATTKE